MKNMATVLLLVAAMSAQNAPSSNNRHHLDIPAISREANGSIVSIVMSDKDGHPIAQGSGFLISKDGHVVTNYHVIRDGNSAVVKLPNGIFFAVDGVLVSDEDRDVAIIKVHGKGFKALTLGDSDRLQVGEEVVAIGNPLSLESTVSNGIVSAIRTVEAEGGKFLQITAPISPGSSGGPLFNMAGNVVGITTSHIKGGENLNFAIPINDVKPMIGLCASAVVVPFPDEPEPATAEQGTGPSLADTLQWMAKSAEGVRSFEDYTTVGSKDEGFVSGSLLILPKDSSCKAFTIIETNVQRKRDGTRIGVSNLVIRFDLGDVDPNSIRKLASGIAFNSNGNRDGISIISSEKMEARGGEGSIFLTDESYRERFMKALKHAVILCGGKPSTF